MSHSAIAAEVQALERLDLEGLRADWRRRWGAPPKLRSVQVLRYMMAWRIQTAALGGVEAKVRARLLSTEVALPMISLEPGTRVAREWKGRRYEVEVLTDGFLYAGARYNSLSEVARTITGTRWNGLRFFGLRGEARS